VVNLGGRNYQAIQWSNGDYSYQSRMSRLYCILWGQDTLASGPVVPAGMDPRIDPNYTYCLSMLKGTTDQSPGPLLAHRFLTAGNPLDPANWQHYSNGNWVSDWNKSTPLDLGGFDTSNGFSHAEFYSPVARKFFMRYAANRGFMLSADLPWGPWSAEATASQINVTNFPCYMLHTYVELTPPGTFRISNCNNGVGPPLDTQGVVLGFEEWTFRSVKHDTPGRHEGRAPRL